MRFDKETVASLRPLEMEAYLRSRGWQEVERLGERASVWHSRRGTEDFEVLLPLDPRLGDYLLRMAEVLSVLESFEQRPWRDIVEDVAAANSDTPREDFELEGAVIRLERAEGAARGTVTVAGVVDGRLRNVRLELEPEDYAVAAEAHLAGRTVRCEGGLAREGRAYVLRQPRRLAVSAGEWAED